MKVLFISGYIENVLEVQDELGRRTEFLQKPLSPSVLVHRVRELLDAVAQRRVTVEATAARPSNTYAARWGMSPGLRTLWSLMLSMTSMAPRKRAYQPISQDMASAPAAGFIMTRKAKTTDAMPLRASQNSPVIS